MIEKSSSGIYVKGAKTNNLKDISLSLPHNKFITVTGVSGSGKSSLVFEILAKEGQRRYFETIPSFARKFLGKLNRPDVEKIEGLSPVISIGQSTAGINIRSTVGTISDLYDYLRLLYARTGEVRKNVELSRSLFSFNSEVGKCKRCNGIGKEEEIDLNKLVLHPDKSIREGALAPTLPNGYIMYSQVTIDVLNEVCKAEGFHVNIPWCELSDEQQRVILYGSEKIKVPFGKHSLESRLKWTGIKAKPREEGYYKGMIPIMTDILRRDRNANILRYVHAIKCRDCDGARLNQKALNVVLHGKNIAETTSLEINELKDWIQSNKWNEVSRNILNQIVKKIDLLDDLGLGHLTLNRSAKSLRTSEIQRIRIANQLQIPLSDVLYVFDEPSIGLHSEETQRLITHFKKLVEKGNTVIVVEHNLEVIKNSDHIIEIGPKSGVNGGELIYNGSFLKFKSSSLLCATSPTFRALFFDEKKISRKKSNRGEAIILTGCKNQNLKNITVHFQLGKLNIVSGKSGVGKSSLVKNTLLRLTNQFLSGKTDELVEIDSHNNLEKIKSLVFIDHSPIGKTPRSNPATYLGISDSIRDIFAKIPQSKERGYTKSRFSFNNKGGRCEECQGAGKTQIGMHFLGVVDLVCDTCGGERFNSETLEIKYNGKSIADIYKLSVDAAVDFFKGQKKILLGLNILKEIGLGYLSLGQSSSTLSGGEAQRIKIANQLQKKDNGNTLFVIIEPSIGLHLSDSKRLVQLFDRIIKTGNTIVCIEQNEEIILKSDWHIELGPKSGKSGGEIVYQGVPQNSKIKEEQSELIPSKKQYLDKIFLNGVTTNGLKNLDVCIPKNKITVVTGLSGSGKSSLVNNTLFSEANSRFIESLSTYNRSFLKQNNTAEISSYSGLGPTIGINRRTGAFSKRSTVGTLSGVYDHFRLLYSRIAQNSGENFTATHFSFNHHLGACHECNGLGTIRECNPEEIIISKELSIFDGAVSKNKAIMYYADPDSQFMATLKQAAVQYDWDIYSSWKDLSEEVQNRILFGTGDQIYQVSWEYKTKTKSGTQDLKAKWLGLSTYINDEYQRKLLNKNIQNLEELMFDTNCTTCNGGRLKEDLMKTLFLGKNIQELSEMTVSACIELLETNDYFDNFILKLSKTVVPQVMGSLKTIESLGLGYLSMNRNVSSLSGGERQRVSLAGQLSAQLYGVSYVLDEPTIGLDRDQVKVLIKLLKSIVEIGNTVVVVEHDPYFIQQADYLIELGPGAGKNGGEIVFQGKLDELKNSKKSVSYRMLNHSKKSKKISSKRGGKVEIKGAFANNLKNIDISFCTGQMIAVTGVSGSGKSSLVKEVLDRSYKKKRAVNCQEVLGLNQFEEVLMINQEVLKQNRSSSTASYTGLLDSLKEIFSKTEQAKAFQLKKTDFSYQSKNGKCKVCAGLGEIKVNMDFMSDVWLQCDTCKGMRYDNKILKSHYKNQSIGEVLNLTITEAIDFFAGEKIVTQLSVLYDVGVGHLKLGQSGYSLSGGETQRLKLAKALLKKNEGKTLYLFDEPSTGLHYFDILNLLEVFKEIIKGGDTIIFIEHNETLIDSAGQVIKLGPGSGVNGGDLI